jgi:hypothetical protein
VDNDQAHDTDHLYVRLTDGSEQRITLANPPLSSLSPTEPWQRSQFTGALETIALEQLERDPNRYLLYRSAHYSDRPSMTASQIQASVPLSAELSIANTESEYIDNLVLNLIAERNDATSPIDVSYVLSASSI